MNKLAARDPQYYDGRGITYNDPAVTLEDFRAKVNIMLRQTYGTAIEHFPTDVIKAQYNRDSRPGLCVLFVAQKYKLVEQTKLSREFGNPSAGHVN